MANNMGLLGRKLGMTQIFDDNGTVIPVTVIQTEGNTVVQVKHSDGPDGYDAIQLGYGERKASRTTKPQQGHFEKAGVTPKRHLSEIRLDAEAAKAYAPGQEIKAAEVFTAGDACDVTGTSKGAGFAGFMKRHNFAGTESTHGVHEFFRHGGAIGTRLTPGHVLKGKKMPGQMGNERVTVQNLQIARLDEERGLLFVRGGVPGPKGSVVIVRKAAKKG